MGAVYIVHSQEDAGRFVAALATALSRAGLDPVTEPWVLGEEESIIDRIFALGLTGSDLLLAVLSRSNEKAGWARFELEQSVTDRIQAVTRFAVVLLDNCDPPPELPGTVPSFRIESPGDFVELSTLIQQLGPVLAGKKVESPAPPASNERARRAAVSGIAGVGDTEATVLALSCRCAIESNAFLVKADDVAALSAPLELDSESFHHCLDLLESAGHIKARRANGGMISTFEVEREAFGHYMDEVIDDLEEIISDLASEILAGVRDNETLVERFELPPLVVTYILDTLDAKGHITVIRQMKGHRRIKRVSPEFKRIYGNQ
jgi:hypothetical protein